MYIICIYVKFNRPMIINVHLFYEKCKFKITSRHTDLTYKY